jgi:hypothetical protein
VREKKQKKIIYTDLVVRTKMSIRARFLGFVDVLMRIPPLFLLDEFLKMNVFLDSDLNNNDTLSSEIINNQTDAFGDSNNSSSIDFYGLSILLFKFVLFLFGKFLILLNFLLRPSEQHTAKKKLILACEEEKKKNKLIFHIHSKMCNDKKRRQLSLAKI